MEMEQDLIDDFFGAFKAGGPKENPTEAHEVEGKQNAYELEVPRIFPCKLLFHELIYAQGRTMKRSPDDKVQGSPMPKAAQKHGQEEIQILSELSFPITAQRNVQIVFEPGRKRNMPTPPKLGDA
jgi:hypothetical protein